MKYSVIYVTTRPGGQEKISVGLIVADNEQVEVRTSDRKIAVTELLLSEKEYLFAAEVIRGMKDTVRNEGDVEYLARYSNNLITVSPLKTIDIPATEQNKDWLFRNRVFDSRRHA